MNMLGFEVIAVVIIVLGILCLFDLTDFVGRVVLTALSLIYCGFMLGIGMYCAALFIQAVT